MGFVIVKTLARELGKDPKNFPRYIRDKNFPINHVKLPGVRNKVLAVTKETAEELKQLLKHKINTPKLNPEAEVILNEAAKVLNMHMDHCRRICQKKGITFQRIVNNRVILAITKIDLDSLKDQYPTHQEDIITHFDTDREFSF